jgi:hypothetical protein
MDMDRVEIVERRQNDAVEFWEKMGENKRIQILIILTDFWGKIGNFRETYPGIIKSAQL